MNPIMRMHQICSNYFIGRRQPWAGWAKTDQKRLGTLIWENTACCVLVAGHMAPMSTLLCRHIEQEFNSLNEALCSHSLCYPTTSAILKGQFTPKQNKKLFFFFFTYPCKLFWWELPSSVVTCYVLIDAWITLIYRIPNNRQILRLD